MRRYKAPKWDSCAQWAFLNFAAKCTHLFSDGSGSRAMSLARRTLSASNVSWHRMEQVCKDFCCWLALPIVCSPSFLLLHSRVSLAVRGRSRSITPRTKLSARRGGSWKLLSSFFFFWETGMADDRSPSGAEPYAIVFPDYFPEHTHVFCSGWSDWRHPSPPPRLIKKRRDQSI